MRKLILKALDSGAKVNILNLGSAQGDGIHWIGSIGNQPLCDWNQWEEETSAENLGVIEDPLRTIFKSRNTIRKMNNYNLDQIFKK